MLSERGSVLRCPKFWLRVAPVLLAGLAMTVTGLLFVGRPQWHRAIYIFQAYVLQQRGLRLDDDLVLLLPPQKYTGLWRLWRADGTLIRGVSYRRGKRHGDYSNYYPNGRKRTQNAFVNGVCTGKSSEWYESGRLKKQGRRRQGGREGVWTEWHENGRKKSVSAYRRNRRHGRVTVWDERGRLLAAGTYRRGEMWDGTFVRVGGAGILTFKRGVWKPGAARRNQAGK